MLWRLCALALVMSGLLAVAPRPPPGGDGTALYVDGEAGTLARIDPVTLADRPDLPTLRLPHRDGHAWWALSGDGSTLVAVTVPPAGSAEPAEATVLDPATGAERARFRLPLRAGVVRLSHDGTRMVVTPPAVRGPGYVAPSATWRVLDTADGRVLSQAEIPGDGVASWVDGAARRVYRVVENAAQTGPEPLSLAAHDLATGDRRGVLGPLLDVPYGTWPLDGSGREHAYAFAHSIAAVALSPDGRRLAVVPAERDEVLLVDAARMGLVGRARFTRRDELLRWLPLWPWIAAAKEGEGTIRQATFAPDGRTLYVHESVSSPGETAPAARLLRGDVESGATVERRTDEPVFDLAVAPDGRSLYVLQPAPRPEAYAWCTWRSCPYVLRRLDGRTLAVLAERHLVGHRELAVAPRG